MKAFYLTILLISAINYFGFSQTSLPPFYEIKSDTAYEQRISSDYLQILEDKSGNWTITDILSNPVNNRFHSFYQEVPDSLVNVHWIRFRIKNSMVSKAMLSITTGGNKSDYYFLKNGISTEHYTIGRGVPWSKKSGFKRKHAIPFVLDSGEELTIYQRRFTPNAGKLPTITWISLLNTSQLTERELKDYEADYVRKDFIYLNFLAGIFVLGAILNFLIYFETKDKAQLYFSLFLFFFSFKYNSIFREILSREFIMLSETLSRIFEISFVFFIYFVRHYFNFSHYYPRWDKIAHTISLIFLGVSIIGMTPVIHIYPLIYFKLLQTTGIIFFIILMATSILCLRIKGDQRRVFIIAVLPFIICFLLFFLSVIYYNDVTSEQFAITGELILGACIVWAVIVFSAFLFKRYSHQEKKILQEQLEKERMTREQEHQLNELVSQQKVALEIEVSERTAELKQSLEELKSTQNQLIQKEKLASLGELTAGIAHEIQNPLNFVNNFSELSVELLTELKEERNKENGERDLELENELLEDVEKNLDKINHHGKRASSIVKGMLEHSKTSTGKKELTDINALADEYLKLSYHGFRANDKNGLTDRFNATLNTDFDKNLPKLKVQSQELGRVLLNLFNNAFYAVKIAQIDNPSVSISTEHTGNQVIIKIQDNGIGMSEATKAKIFQPFFTTKPTGEGTGLGLSLAYDIITKGHGGTLEVESVERQGTTFIIKLPI